MNFILVCAANERYINICICGNKCFNSLIICSLQTNNCVLEILLKNTIHTCISLYIMIYVYVHLYKISRCMFLIVLYRGDCVFDSGLW